MSGKWSISRRQGTCAATGRAFEDGERHVSLLEVVDGELTRSDLSLDAWRAREEEDRRTGGEGPLFWWVTRHRTEPNKTVQLDLDSLERLFVQLEGREETAVRELRYLLCLLLMRKRRVSIQKVERSAEGERMIVKRPRRDQRFEVWVFDFEPERMQELRAELQAVFDGAEGPDGVRLELDGAIGDGPNGDGPNGDGPSGDGPSGAAASGPGPQHDGSAPGDAPEDSSVTAGPA